jgi:hypothetical protein
LFSFTANFKRFFAKGQKHEACSQYRAQLRCLFWSNKRWWLLPMLAILFLFGALIVLAQSSGIAPFIYTLF